MVEKMNYYKKKTRLKILSISLTFVLLPIACAKKKILKTHRCKSRNKKKTKKLA